MSGKHSDTAQDKQRLDVVFALVIVCVLTALTFLAFWVQSLSHDLRVSNDARDALAQQVVQLGAKPVAGPSGSRGEPGKSVAGPRGGKGEKGDPGKDAPTVTPSPGPRGASGSPGRDGADSTVPGPSGSPGADSTVPGPQGEKGDRGDPGADGSPPASWTFTYNGVEYTCTPAADSDESDPRYACESDEPEPPPAEQQNFALDPSRRIY